MTGVTRRALVRAFPMFGVALAMPVAAIASTEDITDKIDRLTQELSEAMGQYQRGQFQAIVGADNAVALVPVNTNPEYRLRRATSDIRAAMGELDSTDYCVLIRPKGQGVATALDFVHGKGTLRRSIDLGGAL